ncbi:mitochondrial mRNA pseudouridine synthase Rpusd3-like isoform X3 [Apostichopus japonicus]|uniref:mitochondrial mRNA pseudouridine synthase Rpusd3-like isoform X3 n=1 Tax=Stichopus japonicus TaxID=307972 RepID=UPI003AB5D8F3
MSLRLGQCCSRLLHVQLEESWQKLEIRFARKIHTARCSSKSKQVQRESLIHVDQSNTKLPENKEELLKILKSNICSHKDGLLVIAKPPGVSVNTGRTDAVSVTEVVPQLAEACNLPFLEIVKAPEKESSGSLLMATDIDKLNEIRNSWQIAGVNHSIRRKFLYHMSSPQVCIHWRPSLVPVRNVSLKSIKSGHAKKATTEYRVLSKNEDLNCALLEIQVDKLRHHQLQVHLGQKMCKILGDHLYSSRVRCILGTNMTANPHEVTPRTQEIPLAMRNPLGLAKIWQQSLVPLHLHWYHTSIPGVGQTACPLLPYFRWTIKQLGLELSEDIT